MISKRNILVGIGMSISGLAGCLQTSPENTSDSDGSTQEQTCTDIEITTAYVEVDYECEVGGTIDGVISVDVGDCDDSLTLEVIDKKDRTTTFEIDPDSDGNWQKNIINDALRATTADRTVRVRGSDGEQYAERPLTVDSYLDSQNLSVWDASFEPETVPTGDPLTVTFGVGTFGGEADFTASLLVDNEPVETREGTIDGGADCFEFSGPEYEFTHTFDDPGQYRLAGEIVVEDSPNAGDRESIGTVTVTD